MSDILKIFGSEYVGVTGIIAKDDNSTDKTYIRPQGTKSISANGTGIDVTNYASVDVSVPQNSFVITLEWNDSTERWEPNKTYAEIASAYQNELEIGLVCDTGNLAGCLFDDEENLFAYYVEETVEETNYNYMTARYFMLTANGLEEDSDGTQWFDSRDANAVASEVASGAQFFTSTGFAIGTATRRSSTDLTASGATVTVPSGYYSAQVSKSVASGTAGTPTATKGTVSNHSVSVTPSVTNTTGYITGGTKSGTAVSVSASELVSGTLTVDSSGTKDVTNYASASIPSGTAGTPSASKGTVSNHSITVTPSVTNTTGWITGSTKTGTAVTVSASELVSGNLPITQNGNNIDCANYSTVSVNVSGSSKNAQVVQSTTRTSASTLTAIGAELTVSKTGTYDIYYSCFRTNTSASYTWATRLYINGTAYGTAENTTWTNNQQNTHLSNISLTSGDKLRVYGRNTRGTSYYICAPMLVIIEA